MKLQKHTFIVSLLLASLAFILTPLANAATPGGIARLSYIAGPVSFSPAGKNQWIFAKFNRPLITGDRLWADANARAELQLGGATVRIGAKTSVNITNLNNRIGQFQLQQGTFNLRVWSMKPGQLFEIDTPNLAFTVKRPGDYRVDVDPTGKVTRVSVRNGRGEIVTVDTKYLMNKRSSCNIYGVSSSKYQCTTRVAIDDFDRWSFKRNTRMEKTTAARYVSREIIGYEDLDNHGSWRATAKYGYVWAPSKVSRNWAPYRNGHWSWINPWGWTWIDNQEWGFAPSHYGRWVNIDGRWSWVPPRKRAALYSPALVAFVGTGSGRSAEIAWFPLGPGEVYVPPYSVSRDYFISINTDNTSVRNTYVTHVYNNQDIEITYINMRDPLAVTAVPKTTFVQSQEVNKATTSIPKEVIEKAEVTQIATVAPTAASVVGEDVPSKATPPEKVFDRPVIAKTTPPEPPVAFDKVQSKLAENPGKPLTHEEVPELKPAPATTEQTKVVNPTQSAVPVSTIKDEIPGGPEKQPSEIKPPVEETQPTTPETSTEEPAEETPEVSPESVTPTPKEGVESKPEKPVVVPQPPESKTPSEQPTQQPEVAPSQPIAPAPKERIEPQTQKPVEVPEPSEQSNKKSEVAPPQPIPPKAKENLEPQDEPQMEAPESPPADESNASSQEDQPESNNSEMKPQSDSDEEEE